MELSVFAKAVAAAWERRRPLRARTDAFRVLNGAASGVPGLVVDHFAGWLVAYAYEKEPWIARAEFTRALAAATGAKGLALIDRGARGEAGRDEGRILFGDVPEDAEVREGPLRFRVHPRHPRNVGLFLDTRRLRERLLETCRSHDVLNLFSYSCSLGIAAAARNTGGVVNVDVSSRYLGWGKDNLALNALDPARTRFVRMDGAKYLAWAGKKGMAFDVVILDPPSFARNEAGVFSFAKDYFRMAGDCAQLLKAGGTLHAMTNYSGITPAEFRAGLEDAVRGRGREPKSLARVEPSEDFDGAEPTARKADAMRGGASGGKAVEGTLLGYSVRLD
jgi:23S rRNA (cytosine1962-C5)-methyltransferase